MVKVFLYLVILLISLPSLALERVTASIDKNPVIKGESFILEVIADDDVSRNALDTSVLMKDFIVGRTDVSSQQSNINGNVSRQTRWTTVLVARNAGKYIIPALSVEGKQTAAIALVALEAQDETTEQRDIYIENELSSENVYVQQQLLLTVKLYVAANISLERASLSDPVTQDATVSQVGKQSDSEDIINGRRYRVIERKYAISPQKSGQLVIDSSVFSGDISLPSRRRAGIFSMNETKPVTIVSDSITLEVKAAPDNYQGQWLPSELLTIHQDWQPTLKEFVVGEPITRTITITALGVTKEQLPAIEMPNIQGLKIYPDQAQLHSGETAGRLASQSVQNFALVASKAGNYELPALNITWWNTVKNRQEIASLPAQTITVKTNPNADPINTQPLVSNNSEVTAEPIIKTVIVEKSSWLQWLFLALWLLTALMWLVTSLIKTPLKNKTVVKAQNNHESYQQLINACKHNDGKQTLQLICPWVQSLFPEQKINTLDQAIAILNNAEISNEIAALQANYYSNNQHSWQGKGLMALILAYNKKANNGHAELNIKINP